MTITATELIAMDDRTMATHASGGFGAKKRNDFIAAVRRAALAETKATAEPVTFTSLMGDVSILSTPHGSPGLVTKLVEDFGGDVA